MNKEAASAESLSRMSGDTINGNVLSPDFTPWLDCGTRAVRGWIESNSAMLHESLGIAEQVTQFSQSRIRTDLDLWQALSGCGSMSELLDCQMQYVKRTASDYLGEAQVLADRVLGAVNRAALPLQEPAMKL